MGQLGVSDERCVSPGSYACLLDMSEYIIIGSPDVWSRISTPISCPLVGLRVVGGEPN